MTMKDFLFRGIVIGILSYFVYKSRYRLLQMVLSMEVMKQLVQAEPKLTDIVSQFVQRYMRGQVEY